LGKLLIENHWLQLKFTMNTDLLLETGSYGRKDNSKGGN